MRTSKIPILSPPPLNSMTSNSPTSPPVVSTPPTVINTYALRSKAVKSQVCQGTNTADISNSTESYQTTPLKPVSHPQLAPAAISNLASSAGTPVTGRKICLSPPRSLMTSLPKSKTSSSQTDIVYKTSSTQTDIVYTHLVNGFNDKLIDLEALVCKLREENALLKKHIDDLVTKNQDHKINFAEITVKLEELKRINMQLTRKVKQSELVKDPNLIPCTSNVVKPLASCSQKNTKRRCLIVCCSHGRNIAHYISMIPEITNEFTVDVDFKPNAKFQSVVERLPFMTENFTKKDVVFIIGGTNNYSNYFSKGFSDIPEEMFFSELFNKLTHTEVRVLEVLPRANFWHKVDQVHFQEFRKRFNETLNASSDKLAHVKIISTINFEFNDLNKSRLHLNIHGIAKLIMVLFASIEVFKVDSELISRLDALLRNIHIYDTSSGVVRIIDPDHVRNRQNKFKEVVYKSRFHWKRPCPINSNLKPTFLH